jgi:hypothetical protein
MERTSKRQSEREIEIERKGEEGKGVKGQESGTDYLRRKRETH